MKANEENLVQTTIPVINRTLQLNENMMNKVQILSFMAYVMQDVFAVGVQS
jgi:hypothetical protein